MKMKCDCLNDCGDDPHLASGKVTPCKRLKAARAEEAARMVRFHARLQIDELRQQLRPVSPATMDRIEELCKAAEHGWRQGYGFRE